MYACGMPATVTLLEAVVIDPIALPDNAAPMTSIRPIIVAATPAIRTTIHFNARRPPRAELARVATWRNRSPTPDSRDERFRLHAGACSLGYRHQLASAPMCP